MRTPARLAVAVAVVAALAGGGTYGFEELERSEIAAQAAVPCDGKTASTAAVLPFDLPLSGGGRVLRVGTQGATTVAFATIPGGRDDLVTHRDAVLEDLRTAGYEVTGTDQEPGYEAEAQLTGPHSGSLRVKPLCAGLLEVRYRLED